MTGSICEHVTDVDSAKIFAAIELSKASWLVALHLPTHDKISVFQVPGGDVDRLLAILERARETAMARGVSPTVEIHTCYEAGYDGFWLHRLLHAHGIHNQVVDSASIQVSRRHRNVKTDHTDAESLLRVLMAWHRGETKACSIVRVPTPEEEDLKRLHRSRETLLHERVRHVNRIRGLLCLQGIRHIDPGRDGWTAALVGLQTRDGRPFPVRLMAEIRREGKLLAVAQTLLREVGAELEALVRVKSSGRRQHAVRSTVLHPVALQLARLRGIGPTFAAVLSTEVFYRTFSNRRAVASFVGLTPTPYSSGTSSREPGISKAGNAWARHNAVELAWLWLRHQPASGLTRWFHARVGDAKGRVRRIAIVALARKLIVALWRFVDTGLVPDGAIVKG
jgi:transposase